MKQPGMRRDNDPPTERTQLQAVVDVVEIHRKVDLVQAADREIIRLPRQQAGRRHGAALVRDRQHVGISGIIGHPVGERMRGAEVRAQDDTSMLHHAAWPKKCRTDGADLTFRFPRTWLAQWRDVANAMERLTARMRAAKG